MTTKERPLDKNYSIDDYLVDKRLVQAVDKSGVNIHDHFSGLSEKKALLSIKYDKIKISGGRAPVYDCKDQRVSKTLLSVYEGAQKRIRKYDALMKELAKSNQKEGHDLEGRLKQGNLF